MHEGISDFDTTVKIFSKSLPTYITSYYNKACHERIFLEKLINYMGSWYLSNQKDIDFNNIEWIVRYSIEVNPDPSKSADELYVKFLDNRRSSKKNWVNKLKKEYEEFQSGTLKKGLLKTDIDSYFSLKNLSGPIDDSFSSREEYAKKRVDTVLEWKDNNSSSLLSFIYFDALLPVQRVKAFMIELNISIYEMIKNDLYGDIDRGFVTSIPDMTFKAPFISLLQSTIGDDVKFDYDNDKKLGQFYNEYSSDGNVVRTIVKSMPMNETDAQNVSVVKALQNTFNLTEKSKALDPIDVQILMLICSNITANVISSGTMTLPLKTIARQFYNKSSGIRGRDYLVLIKRINKLAEYTLSAVRKNDKTKVIEKIIVHFMDVHFQIPTSDTSETTERNIDKELAKVLDEKNDELVGVEMDISETVVQITPGKTITDAWQDKSIQLVYSKTYTQIEDAKIKLFLTIMEAERLRIYPDISENLDISFFTTKIQFNMPASKARTAIKDSLKFLVDKGIVISSFEFIGKTTVHLEFLEVSEAEKLVYKMD